MGVLADIAAVTVGIAFVVAGGSKLAAGDGWHQQAAGLGAPNWSIVPLPWVELAVGAGLVVGLAAPLPALAAIGLLVAFTGLIVVRLSEGRRPPCACFGAWSAKPIGGGHVARNVALLALAFVALGA